MKARQFVFNEVNGELLEINTGMIFHAETILGEYFWLSGSFLY